jgi:hypothetical protein
VYGVVPPEGTALNVRLCPTSKVTEVGDIETVGVAFTVAVAVFEVAVAVRLSVTIT